MRLAISDLLFRWPPDGGARTDVREIARRLARHHEVRLFVPRLECGFSRGAIAGDPGFAVTTLPTTAGRFNPVHYGTQLRVALDQYAPDLVLFTDGWYLKPLLLNRLGQHPYVIRFYAYEGLCLRQHGTFFRNGQACQVDFPGGGAAAWRTCAACAAEWLLRTRSRVFMQEFAAALPWLAGYQAEVRRALAGARAIICYNRFLADKLAPYNARINLVPSGVETVFFAPLREHQPPDPRGAIALLMVGRAVDPAKGYAVLRRAYRMLIGKYPRLRLRVTTDFFFHEDEPGIELIRWRTPEQLPELYRAADIAVVPSVWPEPFGIVALEAMAAGVPLVASRVGGLQDIFVHGEEGLLYNYNHPGELANAIERLILDPQLYCRVRDKALARVRREYTWERAAGRVEEILLQAGV